MMALAFQVPGPGAAGRLHSPRSGLAARRRARPKNHSLRGPGLASLAGRAAKVTLSRLARLPNRFPRPGPRPPRRSSASRLLEAHSPCKGRGFASPGPRPGHWQASESLASPGPALLVSFRPGPTRPGLTRKPAACHGVQASLASTVSPQALVLGSTGQVLHWQKLKQCKWDNHMPV